MVTRLPDKKEEKKEKSAIAIPKEVTIKGEKKTEQKEETKENCLNENEYKIMERKDQGAFSDIFNACLSKNPNDCNYVVKRLPLGQMFENEVAILKRIMTATTTGILSRKIIPTFYDSWTCEKYGYIVLEKMEGDLTRGFRHVTKAVDYEKIFSLLHLLHSLRITSNDMKPANVVKKGSEFYLIDFGISTDYSQLDDTAMLWTGRNDSTFPEAVADDITSLHSKFRFV